MPPENLHCLLNRQGVANVTVAPLQCLGAEEGVQNGFFRGFYRRLKEVVDGGRVRRPGLPVQQRLGGLALLEEGLIRVVRSQVAVREGDYKISAGGSWPVVRPISRTRGRLWGGLIARLQTRLIHVCGTCLTAEIADYSPECSSKEIAEKSLESLPQENGTLRSPWTLR